MPQVSELLQINLYNIFLLQLIGHAWLPHNHHDRNDRLHWETAEWRSRWEPCHTPLGSSDFPTAISSRWQMLSCSKFSYDPSPDDPFPLSVATEGRFSEKDIWHGHQLFSSLMPILLNSLQGCWTSEILSLDSDTYIWKTLIWTISSWSNCRSAKQSLAVCQETADRERRCNRDLWSVL